MGPPIAFAYKYKCYPCKGILTVFTSGYWRLRTNTLCTLHCFMYL